MARSDPTLFGPSKPRPRGRHERAGDRAIAAARADGVILAEHEGAVALLRALARALDAAELADEPGKVATVAKEYRQALEAVGLLPRPAAAAPIDPFAALLDDLETPTHADTP